MTTVQDYPGRLGYWDVGVPPSGPMDSLSFRIGNRILGNPEGAPGLECTVAGPVLRFNCATTICVAGADFGVERWVPIKMGTGRFWRWRECKGPGARGYVFLRAV